MSHAVVALCLPLVNPAPFVTSSLSHLSALTGCLRLSPVNLALSKGPGNLLQTILYSSEWLPSVVHNPE